MDIKNKIEQANDLALKKMVSVQPFLVDIELEAMNAIPRMGKNTILHAGPPIEWERMCGPMQGAIAGILVYEGLASDIEEAELEETELLPDGFSIFETGISVDEMDEEELLDEE